MGDGEPSSPRFLGMSAPEERPTDRPVEVAARYAGPPGMGHGGYVAGLFVDGSTSLQITLRRPTPLDRPLSLVDVDGGHELRAGDEVLADARPAALELDVPARPTLDDARAAMEGSPSVFGERGVHPTCFGCGLHRDDDEGLAIAAGPLADGSQVAAVWQPDARHTAGDVVTPHMVAAALDCAGAFAFIVDDQRAGLLGRIVIEQRADVPAREDLLVTGWRVGNEGRKMIAGTAISTGDGEVLAAARATWFGFPG